MKNPTLLVLVAAIIGVMLLPIPQGARLTLIFLAFLVLIYLKRGYIYVAMGSRALNAKEPDEAKAWRFYEKGWKAGLPANYTVMLGNLYVQRGDPNVAMQIYDSVIEREQGRKSGDHATLISARVSRAMALWVLGRKEESVEILMEVRGEGVLDKNLAVNLGSYLLALGRLNEAGMLIDEALEQVPESLGMTDNRGHYLYLTGQLQEADKLYNKLIAESNPKFPEAYVHAAMVSIALGHRASAVRHLKEALARPFYQTSTITREDVEELLGQFGDLPGSDDDSLDEELVSTLYEDDLFDEGTPNTDIDDDEEVEPNIELDPEDYEDEDEEDPEVDVDPEDISEFESELFEDEYDDEEDTPKK